MRWSANLARMTCLLATFTTATGASSCKEEAEAIITLTTGEELGAFSRAPAPTTLVVEQIDLQGQRSELARTALPVEQISLGQKERTGVGALRVTALDPAGAVLLRGESLFVQYGALEDATFEVFVQRTGELARLPRPPLPLEAPRLGVAVGRYLVGASGTTAVLYDLLQLDTSLVPTLPRPAMSLATFGTAAIVIDDQGASAVDLSAGTTQELPVPSGGAFAEVAGGASTVAPDTSITIVGGTRLAGGTTPRVLTIRPDGVLAFGTLVASREGACATFVEGRGVVIYGGASGPADPAAEQLAPGSTAGGKLAYPPDAVKGCGATTLDASHVLVVGGAGSPADVDGAAPPRVIDLACVADCKPLPWPGSVPLLRAEAITLAPDAALVLGDDATGASRMYRVSPAGAREIPLRVPRRGARLVALPVKGTAAVMGGGPGIEHYTE